MENTLEQDLLKKENEEHEKPLQEFHKCIFRQMTKEAITMAVNILLDNGRNPTDADLKKKVIIWLKLFYVKKLTCQVVI